MVILTYCHAWLCSLITLISSKSLLTRLHHQHHPGCNKKFSLDSNLYPFVPRPSGPLLQDHCTQLQVAGGWSNQAKNLNSLLLVQNYIALVLITSSLITIRTNNIVSEQLSCHDFGSFGLSFIINKAIQVRHSVPWMLNFRLTFPLAPLSPEAVENFTFVLIVMIVMTPAWMFIYPKVMRRLLSKLKCTRANIDHMEEPGRRSEYCSKTPAQFYHYNPVQ